MIRHLLLIECNVLYFNIDFELYSIYNKCVINYKKVGIHNKLYRNGGYNMAIALKPIQCPKCGADLSVEEGIDKFFCSYCGTQIILTNDNEHIFRHINEAEVKQAETERILRLKEMEFEERENNLNRKSRTIAYRIALAFVIIGVLICIIEPIVGIVVIMIGGIIAEFGFMQSLPKKNNEKKEPKPQIPPDEVMISSVMTYTYKKDFNCVVQLFKTAGFSNVSALPLHDLSLFNKKQNGQIDTVTINGSSDFEEGDVFKKDANVLITYHSR